MRIRTGLGQDSHAFDGASVDRPLMLGGVRIPHEHGLAGNSDADVVLHALCNAISSISGVTILGPVTDQLCRDEGITDSAVYVARAGETLGSFRLTHVAVALECRTPKLVPHFPAIRARIAELLGLTSEDIGITATSGEGLSAFGRGEGIQAFVIATAVSE